MRLPWGSTVLMLTSPHFQLGGLVEEGKEARQISCLNEILAFSAHFGGAEEVRIGACALDCWEGSASQGQWIGCRRGRLLMAVRPLAYLPDDRDISFSLERVNGYEIIRSCFYEGKPRTFESSELRHTFGGFVAEHASVEEFSCMAEFMAYMDKTNFTDVFWTTRRVGYFRGAFPRKDLLDLEISWAPGSPVARYATINGETVAQDGKVWMDGLADKDFPFLRERWVPLPLYFPWPTVEADWGDGRRFGVVGDRESEVARI